MNRNEAKELVTLRSRPTKGGGQSLYLDYSIDGIRHREFLRMYLLPEGKNKINKLQNRETMQLAQAAKARRALEIQAGTIGIRRRNADRGVTLASFLDARTERYFNNGQTSTAQVMSCTAKHIREYRDVPFSAIDTNYVTGFCDYLTRMLSPSSALTYFYNLQTTLRAAMKEGLLQSNPIDLMDRKQKPRLITKAREYLTMEELRLLAATPAGDDRVKHAFMFSCFTGLRISDVKALEWSQIRKDDTGWQVGIRQTKTKSLAYIPLSDNARRWLPKRGSGKVFSLPEYNSRLNRIIDKWVKDAGITKHITFHCARHTCATLLLAYGANIYVVMSILGHTDVATTQRYAKIMDSSKRSTVNLIPQFDGDD